MKNFIFTILVSLSCLMFACEGKYAAKETAEEESFLADSSYLKLASKTVADDSLAATYKPIMDKYMELRDELVEANPENASKFASEMSILFDKANVESLDKDKINIWEEQKDAIQLFLKKIADTKDLKVQRNEFYPLSVDVYDLYVKIGLKNYPVYKQFCPMAFKDKGGFWLSNSEEVLNPYFGSKMLHCGEIQEKIFNP